MGHPGIILTAFILFAVFLIICVKLLLPMLNQLRIINRVYSRLSPDHETKLSGTVTAAGLMSPSQVDVQASLLEEKIRDEAYHEYYIDLLRKQIDVEMLKHQIQPHFLYNTLDSIRGQAIVENADDVAAALKALSQYFQYNVQRSDDFVCVSDEIRNIKDYCFIQHFRFEDRYHVEWDYDESDKAIMNTPIPKFTLQPIVENAITHAFSNQFGNHCVITLSLSATAHYLNIKVTDNGIGMDVEQLSALLRRIDEPAQSGSEQLNTARHGIALRNVHQRIKLIFGEQYGLKIYSIPGRGTEVCVTLPFSGESHDSIG